MTPQIIDHPSQHSVSRGGQKVLAIVAHGTAGIDSLAYLTKNERQVSIHYLIPKAGNVIYRMVDESRGANHAGFSSLTIGGQTYSVNGINVNLVTIGFELENLQDGVDPYPETQLLAMGWLINDIRNRRGRLPIFRHAEIDPARRRDPVNLLVADIEGWAARAAAPPLIRRFRVAGVPVYYDSQLARPSGAHLESGDYVEVDATAADNPKQYHPRAGHLASGAGFVNLDGLERA